jgi:ATP-dependent DNA helicase RecG
MFGGEGDEAAAAAEWEKLPALIPIYPATSAVQSWQLADAIELALDLVHEVPECCPRRSAARTTAPGATGPAVAPSSRQLVGEGAAEKRLRFDEAFVTQTVLAQRRQELRALEAEPRPAAGRPARTVSTSGCRSS